jgi:hypothetical protein
VVGAGIAFGRGRRHAVAATMDSIARGRRWRAVGRIELRAEVKRKRQVTLSGRMPQVDGKGNEGFC